MQAGKLRELITLQAPGVAKDGLGQRVESWNTVADVYARAQPLRGREFFAAGQINSEASVKFTIRYRDGVTANMRVLWRGVPHALVAEPMDVDGQRVQLELLCSAGIRDGR